MTMSEKVRLSLGLILLAAGLIWPVPSDDRSLTGMVVVPMMLWVSILCFLGPVVVSWRREIWREIVKVYRGE